MKREVENAMLEQVANSKRRRLVAAGSTSHGTKDPGSSTSKKRKAEDATLEQPITPPKHVAFTFQEPREEPADKLKGTFKPPAPVRVPSWERMLGNLEVSPHIIRSGCNSYPEDLGLCGESLGAVGGQGHVVTLFGLPNTAYLSQRGSGGTSTAKVGAGLCSVFRGGLGFKQPPKSGPGSTQIIQALTSNLDSRFESPSITSGCLEGISTMFARLTWFVLHSRLQSGLGPEAHTDVLPLPFLAHISHLIGPIAAAPVPASVATLAPAASLVPAAAAAFHSSDVAMLIDPIYYTIKVEVIDYTDDGLTKTCNNTKQPHSSELLIFYL
ncbi:hypothetical protein BX616_009966 [Lobosporangium transversale]|uniref:Uncharacterized protein n=1 Tax=Lobosporangium transversale TaxID=64571 RepID=A0A1Y2GJP5_9FUNG|nr:hypothetical protein BCR41DRAFT_397379 [Lobosporangium transversale]KAF9913480.1 hypothetical protein BX616_009966 [Lobosporangium transversale]ORZ12952.1 hypothetical protein BCR41DRAFT_397379 [Lobosporangium transversale]|eukprot:XP_021880301.1 hypothetical protein BCR41DRAFT_397379 [Lobosporangium transversale]